MASVPVLSWRICGALDNWGLLCYFDPYTEDISIRQLTAPERAARLDGSVSVSALDEDEDTTSSSNEKTPFHQLEMLDGA